MTRPPHADQATDQANSLLKAFKRYGEITSDDLLCRLSLRHKPTFRKNYLNPALVAGLIEMTMPDSPGAPLSVTA